MRTAVLSGSTRSGYAIEASVLSSFHPLGLMDISTQK